VGRDADAACFAERRFESTSDDETLKAALSVIAPASKGVRQSAARIAGPRRSPALRAKSGRGAEARFDFVDHLVGVFPAVGVAQETHAPGLLGRG
jgi:hypothetical protein